MGVILQPNLCKIIKEDMRCKKSEKQQNSETNQHTYKSFVNTSFGTPVKRLNETVTHHMA
jgi:hypothetical protein